MSAHATGRHERSHVRSCVRSAALHCTGRWATDLTAKARASGTGTSRCCGHPAEGPGKKPETVWESELLSALAQKVKRKATGDHLMEQQKWLLKKKTG